MKKLITLYTLAICSFAAAQAQTQYYALFMNGAKVGYSIHTRTAKPDMVITSEQTNFTIKRGDFTLNISTTETSYETPDGKPLAFESTENFGTGPKIIKGKINPNGTAQLTIENNGKTAKQTIDFPKDAIMSEAARLLTIKKGFEPGTAYTAKIFSPSLLIPVETQVTIGPKKTVDLLGRFVELTQAKSSMQAMIPINSTAYLNSDGIPLKMTLPVAGINMEIIACEKAYALSPADQFNILETMIVSPVKIDNLEKVKSITYTIHAKDTNEIFFPETNSQTVKEISPGKFQLTVNRQQTPESNQPIPYKGSSPEALAALKPNMYIESDDPQIIKTAKQIVGDQTDPYTAALQIVKFVNSHISKKDLSVGYASASEVLKSAQGDCTEHAVLTAALCRATGIPAQIVTGMIYADSFIQAQNIFGPHAWTAAYIDGKWINLDATRATNSNGFTPTHIAIHISNGSPADFLDMVAVFNNFEIKSLTINHDPQHDSNQ